MKLNRIILLLLTAFFAMQSCLELEPQDSLSDDNIWKSTKDFELFANQFYGWPRTFNNMVFDGPFSDVRSDIMTPNSASPYSNGTNSIQATDGNYTDAYKRIRTANILLKNTNRYPGNQADIATSIGEALFFRAYVYFDLLQLYGDVIITKLPLDITSPELRVARNNRVEVAEFIIEDLKEAARLLPAIVNPDMAGRVNQSAAQAMMSRVALYEGTWQKSRGNAAKAKELLGVAVNAADAVITAKQYMLFKPESLGVQAQRYMFILENQKSNPAALTKDSNKEYIFVKRYDQIINPIGINITHAASANAFYVTRKFANMYLCSDGLPIEKSKNFNGYAKMATEFENRDNRMSNTLMVPGQKYWRESSPRVTWLGDEADMKNALTLKSTVNSGYQNQKWATERSLTTTQEGYDYPVIRYAEVLLNYAEAVFERDDAISDDDLNKSLNLVRQRINTMMPRLTNTFVTNNGLDMRTEIRRERTVELYMEGFRINDLKRWKIAEIEMPKDILGILWSGTEYATAWSNNSNPKNAEGCIVLESGRKWGAKHYLLPLPADQTQLNPNLGNNPGWTN